MLNFMSLDLLIQIGSNSLIHSIYIILGYFGLKPTKIPKKSYLALPDVGSRSPVSVHECPRSLLLGVRVLYIAMEKSWKLHHFDGIYFEQKWRFYVVPCWFTGKCLKTNSCCAHTIPWNYTLAIHMHAKKCHLQSYRLSTCSSSGTVSVQFCSCWFGVPIYWRNKTRPWSSKCDIALLKPSETVCVIILDQHFALSFLHTRSCSLLQVTNGYKIRNYSKKVC